MTTSSDTPFGAGAFERLHQMATGATGLDDFGDEDYHEALRVLLDSYDREAEFTPAGIEFHTMAVVTGLCARLFSQAGWLAHPGYKDVPVEQPLMITGIARTGTTALNRFLCAAPNHQGLDLWLANVPQPRPPRETWPEHPVYRMIAERVSQSPYSRQEFAHIHFVAADAPEECDMLSQQMFLGNMWVATAHVPSYAAWLAEQDWVPTLQRNRRNLQLIGMGAPEQRWVLKNPGHLHNLDEFFVVHPDAKVVWTHRDPRRSIPSICSVVEKLSPDTSPLQTGAPLGSMQLDYYAAGATKAMAARERHPEAFVDVYYDDFVADPMGTVERVYDHLGTELTAEARAVIAAEEQASHLSHRQPDHSYTAAEYGLDDARIDAAFADYLDAYPRVRASAG